MFCSGRAAEYFWLCGWRTFLKTCPDKLVASGLEHPTEPKILRGPTRTKQMTSQHKCWPFLLWFVGCSGPETSRLPAQSLYGAICLFGPWRVTSPGFELKTLVFWFALLVPSETRRANKRGKSLVATRVRILGRPLCGETCSLRTRASHRAKYTPRPYPDKTNDVQQ